MRSMVFVNRHLTVASCCFAIEVVSAAFVAADTSRSSCPGQQQEDGSCAATRAHGASLLQVTRSHKRGPAATQSAALDSTWRTEELDRDTSAHTGAMSAWERGGEISPGVDDPFFIPGDIHVEVVGDPDEVTSRFDWATSALESSIRNGTAPNGTAPKNATVANASANATTRNSTNGSTVASNASGSAAGNATGNTSSSVVSNASTNSSAVTPTPAGGNSTANASVPATPSNASANASNSSAPVAAESSVNTTAAPTTTTVANAAAAPPAAAEALDVATVSDIVDKAIDRNAAKQRKWMEDEVKKQVDEIRKSIGPAKETKPAPCPTSGGSQVPPVIVVPYAAAPQQYAAPAVATAPTPSPPPAAPQAYRYIPASIVPVAAAGPPGTSMAMQVPGLRQAFSGTLVE